MDEQKVEQLFLFAHLPAQGPGLHCLLRQGPYYNVHVVYDRYIAILTHFTHL